MSRSCLHARSAGVLASAVLLLLLTAAVADNNSSCNQLEKKTAARVLKLGWRRVSYGGLAVNVSLLWGSEAAHAAAALLATKLRYVRRYRGVRLPRERTPFNTTALAATVPFHMNLSYSEFIIDLSTVWEPATPRKWRPLQVQEPGLAGPRLAEFGPSRVPTWRHLFAWLAPHVRQRTACTNHVRWTFYDNSSLADCEFVDPGNPQDNPLVVYVFGEDDCEDMLHQCVNESKFPIRVKRRSRVGFEKTLQGDGRSFLFLDYDMWQETSGVRLLESPRCDSNNFNCKLQLDNAVAIRVADPLLEVYAPHLFKFAFDFQPSPAALKLILERQASGVDIEEAACEWVLENNGYMISEEDKQNYDMIQYDVFVFLCEKDSEKDFFKNLLNTAREELEKHTVPYEWILFIEPVEIKCSNPDSLSRSLENHKSSRSFYRLLGAVFLSAEGVMAAQASSVAVAASSVADTNYLPLVFAGMVPEEGTSALNATWRVTSRPRHIAHALLHFVRKSNWTRVAVLSQRTKLAEEFYDALKHETEIVLREFEIPIHITEKKAQKALQELQGVNARIVFVNADSGAASTILAAAAAARMGYEDGFVWIVRDWQQVEVACRTKHFMVSSWTRGLEDIPPGKGNASLQAILNDLRQGQPWPHRAVPLLDALASLVTSYKDFFQQKPNMKQDLHNVEMIKFLKDSLIGTPVTSVSQKLHFKERSLEEMFVFVDQWCGGNFTRLARWRVNATDGAVCATNYTPPANLPLNDGALRCYWHTGDPFWPTCHDVTCTLTVVFLVLVLPTALLVRHAVHRHFTRLLKQQQIQVIAQRRHVAAKLAKYLVERTALELHEELGAGRFGSVRLARLRQPGLAPRYIAAKALRENAAAAEESEFLREACTIASLDHAHVVRLVGVCIMDGPPLVLMELAFFGDLLGYLRARRHLVEDGGSQAKHGEAEHSEAEYGGGEAEHGEAEHGEAEHVSATALTRLAREAAEALQYLALRGVVHRDVRAANCLVDVRRSLKLADFGMARDTVGGVDGAPEYACRRRGMFPVLWMAPESLAHGVFSAASDVWALGVLLLELVTLGARPYGAMSPLRVLEYVTAGGCPPMPMHATPQTRGLARLCWARVAERRPSAAEVAAYLAAWPLLLRPAPLSERDEHNDADSGFGESPSTGLLPRDSLVHSLDQLDGLAATH